LINNCRYANRLAETKFQFAGPYLT